MLIVATPDVTLTPDGRVRLDLTSALRDFLCDLATGGTELLDAIDDLGLALAAQSQGPDSEASADMQATAVQYALDYIAALLGRDAFTAHTTPDVVYAMSAQLMGRHHATQEG